MREAFDFQEHGRSNSKQGQFAIRRLLHLGTVKGCPLCKDIQRRNLSQIREYHFSVENGEVLRVLAICFAYEDGEQPLWDVTGTRTRLFDRVFPFESHTQVAHALMGFVSAESGGIAESIKRGTAAEIDRYEEDYLRKQKEKAKKEQSSAGSLTPS